MTTLHEINTKAHAILRASLGPVDYTRYTQQFSTGSGDYTAERQAREQDPVEVIAQRVADLKAQGKLPVPPRAKVIE
jgi:hypothetical protein